MKKLILSLATLCVSLGAMAGNPLGDIIGGITGGDSSKDAISGLVSGLLGGKVSVASMEGTWTYTGPAVCFKSENFLQKAGGAAAAGTVEGKLKPYYTKLGLTKMQLVVDKDGNFTMTNGKMSAAGTITMQGDDVYFNFQAMGTVKLGKIRTYVTQSGNTMSVMFDVTKLVTVVKAIASVSNNTSVSAISSLLESYDGICVGFKLKK